MYALFKKIGKSVFHSTVTAGIKQKAVYKFLKDVSGSRSEAEGRLSTYVPRYQGIGAPK